MMKRLAILTALGLMLSGCYMVPMALIGPASSGFSTASIIQSGVTSYANLAIKKTTGKTLSKHIYDHISKEIYQIAFMPVAPVDNKKKVLYNNPITKK